MGAKAVMGFLDGSMRKLMIRIKHTKSANFVWKKPGSRRKPWLCCQIRHQDSWASFLITPSTVPPAPTYPHLPPRVTLRQTVNKLLYFFEKINFAFFFFFCWTLDCHIVTTIVF